MGDKTKSIWDTWVTPDLARNPALANDVFKSNNPTAVAPVLSLAHKGVAAQDAINDHIENNGSDSFWNKIGAKTLSAAEWLGKPLQEVQRIYKFNHAVYTDHGFLPGFLVSLGIAGGAVGGGFLLGPLGIAVGADVAGAALRKLSTVGPMESRYKDSYDKSNNPNYIVSPGRDFTNALADAVQAVGGPKAAVEQFKATDVKSGKVGPVELKFGSAGSVLSGVTDAAFDITTDPFMIVGRYAQLMRMGKLFKAGTTELKYPIMDTVPGVKQFLFERSRVPVTSEQIDAVRAGSGMFNATSRLYNRALEDIAQSTAGEIAVKYPTLGTAAAGRLGAIDTADGVHQFLKTSLYFAETEGALAGQAMLPTRTLLRATFGESKVVDILRNAAVAKYIIDAAGNRIKNPEYNPLSPTQRLSSIYKTFSGYMPYSMDPETLKLSRDKFRWNAPDSASVIYRIARFGMGDSAAKIWAGKYAEAVAAEDVALARAIKNQTYFEALKAAGLPEDSALVKEAWDAVNKLSVDATSTQVYGNNALGETLGSYMTSSGNKVAALFKHQASDLFDIPDFVAVKNVMRESGRFSKYIGPIDEFIAKKYTDKIFKPLALATMGFGLRIAASEMLPAVARFGILNTMKAKLAVSAAKANYDFIPEETKSVMGATLVALGAHMGIAPDVMKAGFPAFQEAKRRGLEFAAKMLPEQQLELATKVILVNNGHFLSEGVTTGHGYDASTSYQSSQAAHYYFQIQKNSPAFRDLPEWTTYSSSDIHFVPRWATNLSKAANDTAAKNIAADLSATANKYLIGGKLQVEDNIDKLAAHQKFLDMRNELIDREYKRMMDAVSGKYKGYDAEKKVLSRWRDAVRDGSLRSFATDRVDSILGMTVGKDGFYHEVIARNIANGTATDLNYLADLTRDFQQSVPAGVAGPMLQPYIPGKGIIEKVVNLGFKKVVDPIVNGLAREPIYMMHVADAYGRLLPQVAAGRMLDDQALRIAQVQATYSMIPQIHNTLLRNQFSQYVRNLLPFYFAQEQALRRAYNTLKDTSIASPVFSRGFRFFQLAEHSLNDPAFVQQDDQGNKYVYLPLVGAFGESVQGALAAFGVPIVGGLPITATGSLVSLKSVLPELQMPGVSPIGAISANIISDYFPATTPIVSGTIGKISFDRGIVDTLLPATWFKTALAATTSFLPGGGIDLTNQMGNAMASALAAAYYHGQVPGPDSNDTDRQAFVDRIKNNARSILIIKAFLNLTSPLAPQVKQEDAGIRDEFWKLVKEKGNYADALLEFMGKHGTSAISYTVAKTQPSVRGVKYPYIQETIDFIRDNKNLFDYKSGVSTGAFYLIPQDNAKNQSDRAVFTELVGMHLRSYRSPEELLKQFYVASGDAIMADEIKKHVAIINQANANYDTYTKRQEQDRWSAIMNKMKNLYPIWYADYTNGEGKINAQTAYNQLQLIFSRPDAPQHDQAKLVKALMGDYERHQAVMNQYDALNLRGIVVQSEKDNWENYLLSLRESEPRLKPVIDSVFRKLG